ncbi:hypothetical protein DV737_g2694, partial [Chaetothyriales sp. CBS 132003]
MDSPLTQQLRPDVFEPKIVQLYIHLFNVLANDEDDDDPVPSEGFWREFFLLKPDKQRLFDILSPLTANELLHIQTQTQAFFRRSISEAGSARSPQNQNALENLTAFLSAVFSKRYTNPSTDVIEVLAGLDSIDKLVSDLVNGLEAIIRQSSNLEFRRKAVVAALAMVAGAFHTSLVSYFMHRDLFPALMKYIHDAPDSSLQPFVLIGLLANYNKFEAQNVYQNRLEDFVNEDSIKLLVQGLADSCRQIRDEYVAVQDDEVNAWSLSTTLNFVGLRALSPERKKPTPPTGEEAKALFNALPTENGCVMLSAYSFYSPDMIYLRGVREELCTPLARLIAFCLSRGDAFLPDPASYDDLFYKLIEASDILPKFKDAFAEQPVQGTDSFSKAMNALLSVSSHYHELLGDHKGRKTHQSPAAVQKVIHDGYESLNLPSDEDFGTWQKWRESSMKADLKKMIRTAVDDARLFALK